MLKIFVQPGERCRGWNLFAIEMILEPFMILCIMTRVQREKIVDTPLHCQIAETDSYFSEQFRNAENGLSAAVFCCWCISFRVMHPKRPSL